MRIKEFKFGFDGTRVVVQFPGGVELDINSKLIGEFNVYNISSAVAVGYAIGIEYEDIKRGIEAVENVKGRFEKNNFSRWLYGNNRLCAYSGCA